ncbi:hypothetical protein M9H77_30174 [Catharanthus roseus]|uniref:Uncharacterized protein n=1 Tax=Catharanthus roseus TaxID=4058 RepID=A0ACB9ZXU4_CATRO|nr:hypothetical protein M9H77_30174 [Catharanthus roseus]
MGEDIARPTETPRRQWMKKKRKRTNKRKPKAVKRSTRSLITLSKQPLSKCRFGRPNIRIPWQIFRSHSGAKMKIYRKQAKTKDFGAKVLENKEGNKKDKFSRDW